MPIRVTCQCGQSLSVPDEMAGKSGKCPKCKGILKVPAANPSSVSSTSKAGSAGAAGKPSAAKPAAATLAAAPSGQKRTTPTPAAPVSNMGGLFDEVGLVQKKGQFCPACDAPVAPNSVICVKCGFNFAEGTKVEGVKVAAKRNFGNKQLNEAAAMMDRETATEKRLLGTGSPWWMMLSILLGFCVIIALVSIKMSAGTTGTKSSNEFMHRIQDASYLVVVAASAGGAMYMIAMFSVIAILISAFKESTLQGLLCMFAPFYIIYYMFSRLFSRHLATTVLIYWVTSILAGVCLGYAMPRI